MGQYILQRFANDTAVCSFCVFMLTVEVLLACLQV